MPTVFISQATQDAQFAHRLADDLRRLGEQVWIGPDSTRSGGTPRVTPKTIGSER